MTTPTGLIKTKIPNVSTPVHWEDITQYDEFIKQAAEPLGWSVDRGRGHIAIESQGIPSAKQTNPQGDSYGLMQVVPYTKDPQAQGWEGWHKLVKEKTGLPANASKQKVINALYDPAINIAVGVAILESYYQQYGTTDKASSAFFTGRSDWGAGDTVNGTTGKQYQAAMNGLITEQRLFGDVIDRLFGGNPYDISADYGQAVTWQCPLGIDPGRPGNCYEYFEAYGLDDVHHWAYDVSAAAGDGAPLYAPFNGTVVCGGTDNGPGAWGTGCAAFGRLNNYGGKAAGTGAGRLELLHEDGNRSLIFGHALNSRVKPGDRVQAGDLIGQQGGMNASHVHLEGRYANGTRIGDPRVLFPSSGEADVEPPPATRIPYDWDDDPNLFTVKAVKDLKVYQRADPGAAVIDAISKGDTFQAIAVVPGNDGKPWYLGASDGRVPMEGTEGMVRGGGTSDDVDLNAAAVQIEDTRQKVNALLQGLVSTLEEGA